jgi:hypothetical protein
MLNHHSELAIPSESYFLVPLWERYRRRPNIEALLADLRCLRKVHEWRIDLEEVHRRLPERAGFSELIQAVYQSYAEARGKLRFGDKTPLYIQYLDLLEQVFPGAQYIHIVRDGRNAALSHDEMLRRPRLSWIFPQGLADFAYRWRRDVLGARRFGTTVAAGRYFELRYEDLVAEPERRLREISSFLGLRFETAMLEYYRDFDTTRNRNHKRLAEPPTPGLTDWRKQMRRVDIERFEALAGDLLDALGYERAFPNPSAWARTRAIIDSADSRGRLSLVRLAMPIVRRSPAWRLRQAYILRTSRSAR